MFKTKIRHFIIFSLVLLFLSENFIFSHDIKELSYFMIMGEIELRKEKGFSQPVVYKTLNHEGGMKVRVIQISNRDTINGKSGVWIHVITTAPMWVNNGEWIDSHTHYWVFLEDNCPIFDYEE